MNDLTRAAMIEQRGQVNVRIFDTGIVHATYKFREHGMMLMGCGTSYAARIVQSDRRGEYTHDPVTCKGKKCRSLDRIPLL